MKYEINRKLESVEKQLASIKDADSNSFVIGQHSSEADYYEGYADALRYVLGLMENKDMLNGITWEHLKKFDYKTAIDPIIIKENIMLSLGSDDRDISEDVGNTIGNLWSFAENEYNFDHWRVLYNVLAILFEKPIND